MLALAGPAAAHVEPSPAAVQAGSPATIELNVEHGCGEAGATKIEIQVPDGVTGAAPQPGPAGWRSSVAGQVVTFTGGPQGPRDPITFAVRMTMPAKAGTVLYFPTLETCTKGSIDWIEKPVAGQAEPEHVAPAVKLTAGPPTQADLGTGDAASATAGDHGHDEAASSDAAGAPSPAKVKSDTGANAGLVIGIAVVVLLLVAGAAVLLRRKRA